ncbi:MAG: hypothetical protein EA401_13850 [Planctomycetota bacterium]|nr:MAG: hypothetical protein EA401_13850 [Planctomycetota bacterium]
MLQARAIGFLAVSVVVALAVDAAAEERKSPAYMPLENVPPSPSTASGERIWPDPGLSHWPAIMYRGESRNASLRIPLRQPGASGAMGWNDALVPFQLPRTGASDAVSGLIPIPGDLGLHQGVVEIGSQQWPLRLHIVSATDRQWPHADLHQGFPVDADGMPLVVRLSPDAGRDDRRWSFLRPSLPRPEGRPLLIGDPLKAMGRGLWDDDDPAWQSHSYQGPWAHHAALLALAQLPDQLPRTLVWSPGNAAIEQHRWNQEELRFLEVVNQRFAARQVMPRRILLLPPLPVAEHLHPSAQERRRALRQHATNHGWRVLDAERMSGGTPQAQRWATGAYTRYPVGEAQKRIRAALLDVL